MKITQRRRIAAVALVSTGALVGAVLVAAPASAGSMSLEPNTAFNTDVKEITVNSTDSEPAYGGTLTLTRIPAGTGTETGTNDPSLLLPVVGPATPVTVDFTDGGTGVGNDGPANVGTYDASYTDDGLVVIEGATDNCVSCFTVLRNGPIKVGATAPVLPVNPSALRQGDQANVTVTGDNFERGSVIKVVLPGGDIEDPNIFENAAPKDATGADVGNGITTRTTVQRRWNVLPSAARGPRDVVVTNIDGSSARCIGCFTVNGAPLTSVNPTGATNNPDQQPELREITFNGSGLEPNSQVSLTFIGHNGGVGTGGSETKAALSIPGINPVFNGNGTSVTATFDLRNQAPGNNAYVPTVTNPDGSVNSCVCQFDLLQPAPAAITSLDGDPDTVGNQNSIKRGETKVFRVTGTRLSRGFVTTAGAGITNTAMTLISDTEADVTLAAATSAAPGPRTVDAVTTEGTSTGTDCVGCLVVENTTVTPTPTGTATATPTATATSTATATPTATATSTATPTATATATPTATATSTATPTATATATSTPTATATATSTATPTATATSASPTATPTTGTDTNGRYVALGTPVRVVDSRPAPDNKGTTVGKKLGTVTVDLSNVLGGTNAQSAVLNLTVVDGNASGNAVVHAGGSPVPETSNINYTRGQIQANQVVTLINQSTKTAAVTVRGSATHVIVDMVGYFTAENVTSAGRVVLQTPRRVAGAAFEKNVANGSVLRVTFGPNDLPPGSTSALLNVTVAGPDAPSGFVVAYPTGTSQPATSNVNFVRGLTQANEAIARVGAGNSVDLKISRGGARLIVDVVGGVVPSEGQVYSGLVPDRFVDTRPGSENQGANPGRKVGTFNVTLPANVPAGATGVVLNVTSVDAQTGNSGFIVAYPAGTSQPATSNVNWRSGATQANEVIVAIGANRQISLNVGGSKVGSGVHIVVDLVGYLSPTGASVSPTATASTTDGQGGAATGGGEASTEPSAEGEPTEGEGEPTPTATAEECFPGPDPLCL